MGGVRREPQADGKCARGRRRETRYVCVLIAPGAVASGTLDAFSQVTAPRITPPATRCVFKRRRIAFCENRRAGSRRKRGPASTKSPAAEAAGL